jgi:peptidoglycan/LPS O-acetylase OafA/YrhL
MAAPLPHLWVLGIRFAVYFAFAFVAVNWRRWQKRRREAVARGWPEVEGVVLAGHVTPVPKTSCFLAILQYTYFVEEYRTGTYFHEFARESDADAFVRHFTNQRIPIRYRPSNPDNSVLEQTTVDRLSRFVPRFSQAGGDARATQPALIA